MTSPATQHSRDTAKATAHRGHHVRRVKTWRGAREDAEDGDTPGSSLRLDPTKNVWRPKKTAHRRDGADMEERRVRPKACAWKSRWSCGFPNCPAGYGSFPSRTKR